MSASVLPHAVSLFGQSIPFGALINALLITVAGLLATAFFVVDAED
jgi:hypothetical protein